MTPYKLEYTVNADDLLATGEYFFQHSSLVQKNLRKQRWSYLVGFLFMGIFFAILGSRGASEPFSTSNLLTSILVCSLCAIPGIAMFVILPRMIRKNYQSNLKKAYSEETNILDLGPRELVLETERIIVRNDFFEFRYSWAIFNQAIATSDYISLARDTRQIIMIPKNNVTVGDWREVEKIIEERIHSTN